MPNQNAVAAALAGVLCVLVVFVAVYVVVAVFYFRTLHKALAKVAGRNRLEPGLVWLGMIPLFNDIWSFFIAERVPGSLRNEFADQGRDDGSDYGRGIGLAKAVLGVVVLVFSAVTPALGNSAILRLIQGPIGLAWLVLFIIFWVKIAGYSGRLERGSRQRRGRGDEDRYDGDYDDGPRRRAGRDDDYDDEDDRPRARKRRRDEEEYEEDVEERPARRRRDEQDEGFTEDQPPRRASVKAAEPVPPPPPQPVAGGDAIVQCSSCQKRLKVPASAVGKKVRCPSCGATFVAQ